MKDRTTSASALLLGALLPILSPAQETPSDGDGSSGTSTVELAQTLTAAPPDFDVVRPGIARGTVVPFEYESGTGDTFRATLYLPPGYSSELDYPVLYLLHGATGDEHDWLREMSTDAILDNLHADEKLAPMLVVMPSSLSVAARAEAGVDREAKVRAGMGFGRVLVDDLIPFVESNYPARPGREHRAIAGVSMGGALALATGTANADTFAWIGAFSGAGRRWTEPREALRLLWLSVGNEDTAAIEGMAFASAFFAERSVPHRFHVNAGGHEPKVWKNGLFYFAPLLFQEKE